MESRASSRLSGVMTKSDVQQYHPQRPTKPRSISMSPNQLDLLPPDQAAILIRKKRFWKRTMWISLASALITGLGGFVYHETYMNRISESSDTENIHAYVSSIFDIMLIVYFVFIPLAALCFLVFLVSIIRIISLPKMPRPSNSESIPHHRP
jgi:hypothetical protein